LEVKVKERPVKSCPAVGCCGLDCGLCPRYYTAGPSRCPGCCGPDFYNKHPSCSYITCCVVKKGLESCGQCKEFPCLKFKPWLKDAEKHDSFLTHQKILKNLAFIKKRGLKEFVEQQSERIGLLNAMLKGFDDGRSKSYYCVAAAVMETGELKEAISEAGKGLAGTGPKEKAAAFRCAIDKIAAKKKYILRLRK